MKIYIVIILQNCKFAKAIFTLARCEMIVNCSNVGHCNLHIVCGSAQEFKKRGCLFCCADAVIANENTYCNNLAKLQLCTLCADALPALAISKNTDALFGVRMP